MTSWGVDLRELPRFTSMLVLSFFGLQQCNVDGWQYFQEDILDDSLYKVA